MSRESYPNLIDELAIVKGETYRKLIENNSISFDGDLTEATVRGQIRDATLDNEGRLLAIISFEESVYDADLDKTFLKPYLTEFATINLPSTPKYLTGRTPNTKTNLIYDIELVLNDEIIKKAPGFIQVIGEVTGGEVIYNPAQEWQLGIASVELLSVSGLTRTYQIWGDVEKTVNLGTFEVLVTPNNEGVIGVSNALPVFINEDTETFLQTTTFQIDKTGLSTEQKQDLIVEKIESIESILSEPLDVNIDVSQLTKDSTLSTLSQKIPALTLQDDRLKVDTNLSPLTLAELSGLTVKVEEQNELDLSALTSLDEKIPIPVNNRIPVDIGGNGSITITAGEITVANTVEITNDEGTPIPVNGTIDTGLDQPLTLAQLQGLIVKVEEQSPLDINGLATNLNQDTTNTRLGDLNETAPASDTAIAGINGRLQRIAQRITSLIGLLPGSLGSKTAANSFPVTLPTDQVIPASLSVLPPLSTGSNIIGSIANTTFAATQSGNWDIRNISGAISLPTGASTSANQTTANTSLSSIDTKLPANLTVNSTRLLVDGSGVTQPVSQIGTWNIGSITTLPNITLASESGFLTYRNTSLSNTAQTVKASGGNVMGWNFINPNTVPVYVKFFNIASGSVVVGTSAVSLTIMVPPSDGVTPGLFFLEPSLIPVEVFSIAISIACVTGLADNSTAAPSTAIHVSVRYK